jgi:sugar (pentulose or hexulose) kinase
LGTAVVAGVYSDECKIDPAFRTLIAASGHGFILESVIRTGTYLLNWFLQSILKNPDIRALDQLNQAAAAIRPGAEGLLLVPYLSGTMTPYWNPEARGLLFGLGSTHDQTHFYRAILEGIGFEVRLMLEETRRATQEMIDAIVVFGGGSQSTLWCQTIADIVGLPVRRLNTGECASLGAAVLGAVALGWFPSTIAAATEMGRIDKTWSPDPERHQFYTSLFDIYKELYPRLQDLFAKLQRVTKT